MAAYGISYGIVDGKTLNKREVVPKFMEAEGFTIRKLKEGTQYWFKVQAIYEEFAGPWSEKVEGTTGKPQPPVNFKVKKNTGEAKWFVNVSWENNPLNDERKLNIEEYRVKCWDSNNPTSKFDKTFTAPTQVSTKGVLETSGKVNYVCSVQVKTDKGTLSEVKQSGVLAFDDIEKPAVSKRSESWGTPIRLTKVADHSYKLKQDITGVAFDDSTGEVTATQPAANIIIVAKRRGYTGSVESELIEFTRQAGSTLKFANIDVPVQYGKSGNTHTQAVTNDRVVAGDTGVVSYSISPTGAGASIDTGSGKVDFTVAATGNTFTITARKAESAKYEAQRASYQLRVQWNTNRGDITKPAVSKRSERWGTPIKVTKVADHRYGLNDPGIAGVAFDESTGEVTATQPTTGIITIVADRIGYAVSVESDPIEFTRQVGSTLKFANIDVPVQYGKGNTHTQTVTNDRVVAEDTGVVSYSISPTGVGASIDTGSGKVDFTVAAIGNTFTITARKAQSAKYEAQRASYQLRVQANTNTADITKPAVSKRSESWGTPIRLTKVADHSYELKQDITGVVFDDSTGEVTATQPAANIIIVAKRRGYTGSVESELIEFTRQAGSTLKFANIDVPVQYGNSGNTHIQTVTNDRVVAGDTGVVSYSISPMGAGASIDTGSGKVDFALGAIGTIFTITARKAESTKYEAQRASYQLRVQANTNTADITKPAVSKRSESWGKPIIVRKVADHSYELKQAITGVVFDKSTGQITATQPAARIIIVAKRRGYTGSVESDPIEFTRQAGNTLKFVDVNKNTMYATGRNTYTQVATNDRSVRGDTRNIEYSISPMGVGASIDTGSGKVDFTVAATGNTFTITARKAESAKYEAQRASYQLTVAKFKTATKAELKYEIKQAIRAHGNEVDLNYIDTSQVTDMSELFEGNTTFNGDISKWNTSKVTNMSLMFSRANAFNQPLNNWNVSRVTNMYGMFNFAYAFNQPLNNWNVSSVKDMSYMFAHATLFSQDLTNWGDISKKRTTGMFAEAKAMHKNQLPPSMWSKP